MFDGFDPQFGKLETDLANLGIKFARRFVKDMAVSVKDGYQTTKKVIG